MLGTLFGLIFVIYGLVLRYDPEACRSSVAEDEPWALSSRRR
jgi:hypothetical protein